jgi:hypothetical protein
VKYDQAPSGGLLVVVIVLVPSMAESYAPCTGQPYNYDDTVLSDQWMTTLAASEDTSAVEDQKKMGVIKAQVLSVIQNVTRQVGRRAVDVVSISAWYHITFECLVPPSRVIEGSLDLVGIRLFMVC